MNPGGEDGLFSGDPPGSFPSVEARSALSGLCHIPAPALRPRCRQRLLLRRERIPRHRYIPSPSLSTPSDGPARKKPFSCRGRRVAEGSGGHFGTSPPPPGAISGWSSQNRMPGQTALFIPKFGALEGKTAVPESWAELPEDWREPGCPGTAQTLWPVRDV